MTNLSYALKRLIYERANKYTKQVSVPSVKKVRRFRRKLRRIK